MKKTLPIIVMFVLVGAYPTYVHKDQIAHTFEEVFSDRADVVLNANVPEVEPIETFKNETHGQIQLLSGKEETSGFRHILARHTKKYFVNFTNKNEKTLFADDVSGTDLIYGIKEFYENCVDIGIYNRSADRNLVFVGFVELNGKNVKCILIVRQENKQIVTFYPFNEVREQELFDEVNRIHND